MRVPCRPPRSPWEGVGTAPLDTLWSFQQTGLAWTVWPSLRTARPSEGPVSSTWPDVPGPGHLPGQCCLSQRGMSEVAWCPQTQMFLPNMASWDPGRQAVPKAVHDNGSFVCRPPYGGLTLVWGRSCVLLGEVVL